MMIKSIWIVLAAMPLLTASVQAQEDQPDDYVKVEIRGKLNVFFDSSGKRLRSGLIQAERGLWATIWWEVDFGSNKKIALLAQRLQGKRVVLTGTLQAIYPAPPKRRTFSAAPLRPRYVIQVGSLKPAEAKSK